MTTAPAIAKDETAFVLNPFGYWPRRRSVFAGLGGNQPSDPPTYAFCTPYTAFGSGTFECVIAFEGLSATSGQLAIRVIAMDVATGIPIEEVLFLQPSLSELVRDSGIFTFPLSAEPERSYAILGHVPDATDAAAKGLSVTVRQRGDVSALMAKLSAGRGAKAASGGAAVKAATMLLSGDRPTLRNPVSQGCTASQFDEPDYRAWCDRFGVTPQRDVEQWSWIYVLQVLERYGALGEGKVGLGLGAGHDPLTGMLASLGCHLVVTSPAASGDDAAISTGRAPEESFDDDPRLAERISVIPAARGTIPSALGGFDFLWSRPDEEDLHDFPVLQRLIEHSLACLQPGGIAVHVLRIANDAGDGEGSGLPGRSDLARLATRLMARGHAVAQIRDPLAADPQEPISRSVASHMPFGIVVRKGR